MSLNDEKRNGATLQFCIECEYTLQLFQFVKSETGYFSQLEFSMDPDEHSALGGARALEEAAFLQCSIATSVYVHALCIRVCAYTVVYNCIWGLHSNSVLR